MTEEITREILKCDEPSPRTGRTYPKDVMREAFAEYQERIDQGVAMGTLGESDSPSINLSQVSHKVTSVDMDEDGTITGTVKVMDTLPMGAILKDILENAPDSIRLAPRMTGVINKETGEITDVTLISIDFMRE